jgi:hypothetical protein
VKNKKKLSRDADQILCVNFSWRLWKRRNTDGIGVVLTTVIVVNTNIVFLQAIN